MNPLGRKPVDKRWIDNQAADKAFEKVVLDG
jgi:hypothetical protein